MGDTPICDAAELEVELCAWDKERLGCDYMIMAVPSETARELERRIAQLQRYIEASKK